ncbi:type II toxin-antitoxin system RelE/ParE family toxin [Blastomonas sp.]|uniref:type II toxin-antitoxin system RelE/ParE family toxin n=1 Tax=Blastomonas sp. TaxID=1909299 RepID=UPI0035946C02
MRLDISKAADADLDDIIAYSAAEWGAGQGIDYVASFKIAFDRIVDNPGIGQRVSTRSGRLRKLKHRKHIFYYGSDETRILIVRVLHASMDASRHLT